MKILKKCTKTGWCADCTDEHCWFAGNPGADCPRWQCVNPVIGDCANCKWLAEYKRKVGRKRGGKE